LLRRSSCGFARTEPMVCCSSQLVVREEEEKVITQQRVGDNSLTPTRRVDAPTRRIDTPTRRIDAPPSGFIPIKRVGDAGSSAVKFGGSTISTVGVETSRRAGEEEFSKRNGFGEERRVVEEDDSGEDWGEVSSSEEELDQSEHGGDEEWRGGDEGEIWGFEASDNVDSEEYEGEDWGVQSLGTKCITAFDCV